jgi:hypothetical protein
MLRACSEGCRYLTVASKMLQFRPDQVCTVHRVVTRNTTALLSTQKPRTRDFSWAPDGLQNDIDTDRVMVKTDTSILIRYPKLNDFQIKRNSVFNTISEWFMVNSLSLNLNKTFYGIKVFRMNKYIIRIMMSCKRRESCIHTIFQKFKNIALTLSISTFFAAFCNQQ